MLHRPSHPSALRVSFKKALSPNLRNGRQWGLSFPQMLQVSYSKQDSNVQNSPAGSFLTTAAAQKPPQL